jgi:CelD/BcsL family acetyltransferase involved in cellulose biosynthesis
MAVKIGIIDPTTDNRWDRFVASQEHSTVFHTSAWAKVIQEAYSYLPRYYVAENGAGQFTAAIPFFHIQSQLTGKRLVCLPFSDACWPLGEEQTEIVLLFSAAKREIEAQQASRLEIRGWQHSVPPAELGLVTRHYHSSYVLDLEPDPERLANRLHHSVRRGIHQAQKRGVAIRWATSEEYLKEFYRLNVVTRKKLGVLPQPYAFFKAIFRHIIPQKLGFLMIAEWEGKIIAGVLFLTQKDTVYYKFNASDENYRQKRPNHLLIWEAIRYACTEGYNYLDFGRCSPEEEGLRTFKRRWAAKEIELPYYYYPSVKGITTDTENSLRYRMMRLISHAMPEFAFRAAGSLLYKHFG